MYLVIRAPSPTVRSWPCPRRVFAVLAVAPATLFGVLLLWIPSRVHVAMFVDPRGDRRRDRHVRMRVGPRHRSTGPRRGSTSPSSLARSRFAVAAVSSRGGADVEPADTAAMGPLGAHERLGRVGVHRPRVARDLRRSPRARGDVRIHPDDRRAGHRCGGPHPRRTRWPRPWLTPRWRARSTRRTRALRDAADALDRVRDANDTLRESEEHLRLIFESAEDGIGRARRARGHHTRERGVHRDGPPRQGRARGRALDRRGGLGRRRRRGLRGAAAGGQSPRSAAPRGSPCSSSRASRGSPWTHPGPCIVIRDVTAAQVADQTIRSLFQFLQDRDEDRTQPAASDEHRDRGRAQPHRARPARRSGPGRERGVAVARGGAVDDPRRRRRSGPRGAHQDPRGAGRRGGRAATADVRPAAAGARGARARCRRCARRWMRFGTEHWCTPSSSVSLDVPLPEDLETLAYRVVQEALGNVARTRTRTACSSSVESDEDSLRVEIEDDGRGLRQRATPASSCVTGGWDSPRCANASSSRVAPS